MDKTYLCLLLMLGFLALLDAVSCLVFSVGVMPQFWALPTNYGFFASLPVRPLACSPSGSFALWLVRSLADLPPVEYTGDSLLRLVFQFTEWQQTSVASRH